MENKYNYRFVRAFKTTIAVTTISCQSSCVILYLAVHTTPFNRCFVGKEIDEQLATMPLFV